LSAAVAKPDTGGASRFSKRHESADRIGVRPLLPQLLLSLACVVPVRAQSALVVPKAMAGVEGIGGSSLPFQYGQPVRYMCVYNAEELPFSGPQIMSSIWVRAEHSVIPPNDSFAAKQFLTVTIAVSTTTARAETQLPKFSDYHGTDYVIVLAGANVALPPQPTTLGASGVPAPRPFNVPFVFKQPTFFDVSPVRTPYGPQAKGLVVEMLVTSQPNTPYLIDSPLSCSSKVRWFGKQGPRCVTSPHRQPLGISSDDSLLAGGTVTFTVSEVPPGNPFAVILGSTSKGTWQGQPLPVDLTALGGFDCWINVDWIATTVAQADAQGIGRANFGVPSGRFVVGLELLAQALAYDIGANPLLASSSLGIGTTVCGPLGVARIANLGSSTATSGAYTYGASMIFEAR
jgi:hypothetical protein